jgi:putative MATE family efflux protein
VDQREEDRSQDEPPEPEAEGSSEVEKSETDKSASSSGGLTDLTDLDVSTGLLRLAGPILSVNILRVAIGWIILRVLGQLGPQALAAIGFSKALVFWVVSAMWTIPVGAAAVVARRMGEENEYSVQRSVAQSLMLGIGVGAFASIICVVLAPYLLPLLGAEPEVIDIGVPYLRLYFAGLVFMTNVVFTDTVFSALGYPKASAVIRGFSAFSELGLTYAFVTGWGLFPELGIVGAGLGFFLARLLAFALGTSLLLFNTFTVRLADAGRSIWKPDFALMGKIVKIGLPRGFEGIANTSAWLLLVRIIGLLPESTVVMSVFVIGRQVERVLRVISFSLGKAAQTMVGQNLGASRPDRSNESGYVAVRYGLVLIGVASLVAFLQPELVVQFFSADPRVLAVGSSFVRVMGIYGPLVALAIIFSRALRGAGDTSSPMYIVMFALWLFQVPGAWILGVQLNWGALGIWAAIGAGWIVRGLLMGARFRQGHWQQIRI